ncbi:universal stress protein [Polyangium sp. 15x6]|uniref:universal stress protein n=1 Tax=Polyangium sp. 15x6 TaxID=3042687 RepID=UPI00249B076D|nr:universal stress protein [Polyangium sp. 15x6]MDI3287405.1 universal stress protein [Polyangium sp. 15x6]
MTALAVRGSDDEGAPGTGEGCRARYSAASLGSRTATMKVGAAFRRAVPTQEPLATEDGRAEALFAAARCELDAQLARVPAELVARGEVRAGEPVDVLCDLAAETHARFVVIGAHGHSAWRARAASRRASKSFPSSESSPASRYHTTARSRASQCAKCRANTRAPVSLDIRARPFPSEASTCQRVDASCVLAPARSPQ